MASNHLKLPLEIQLYVFKSSKQVKLVANCNCLNLEGMHSFSGYAWGIWFCDLSISKTLL